MQKYLKSFYMPVFSPTFNPAKTCFLSGFLVKKNYKNMEWYHLLLVVLIGLFAGFMNTLAGGGSLLSLPLLIFLGLPANVANGTNRIAILLQNVVGVASFKQQKVLDQKTGFYLGIPAFIGAFIGAQLASDIDEILLKYIIAGILVMMFFLVILKPNKWLKGDDRAKEKPGVLKMIIFFFIGIYGGFIQAGVGFFLLAGLVLGAGFDLVKANALKVFIVLIYTPIALVVFMYNGHVDYVVGLILAIGNMAGAYIGSRMAVKKGSAFVQYVLLFALGAMAAKLFGLFDYLYNLVS
jgi:uncharacterized membrane protein YfcA